MRQLQEISEAFALAHELGMFTVLWCYARNSAFKADRRLSRGGRPHRSGQPPRRHHRSRHHQAEAAREQRTRSTRSSVGKGHPRVYDELVTDHPIDLTRWQVVNCYMGRAGLINSGGASSGASDLAEAVRTAVINKRAGGMGLISGRKAFQRPMDEGARAAQCHPGRLPRRLDNDCLNPVCARSRICFSSEGCSSRSIESGSSSIWRARSSPAPTSIPAQRCCFAICNRWISAG